MRRALCLGLWVIATVARAQQAVADDFESGNLNAWDVSTYPGISLAPSTAAAHRGTWGLRLTDTETTLDGHQGSYIERSIADAGPDVYARAWFRLISNANGGGTVLWATQWQYKNYQPGTANDPQLQFDTSLAMSEQDVYSDGGVDYDIQNADASVGGAGWVLLETASVGCGTGAAVEHFAVNGVPLLRDPLHGVADHYTSFQLGEVYAYYAPYMPVFDFDDVRVDYAPQPSRLALGAAGALESNQCQPLQVGFLATFPSPDGGQVSGLVAPYDVVVNVSGLPTFEDSLCTRPDSGVVIAKGTPQGTIYLRVPDAGTFVMQAEHRDTAPDFFAATFSVTPVPYDAGAPDAGAPDAGTRDAGPSDAGPRDAGVDAGQPDASTPDASTPDAGDEQLESYYALQCSQTPGGLLLGVGVLMLRRRRRVSPRATA